MDFGQKILDQLLSIKIMVCPEFAMGLDGTTRYLSLERGWNSVEYKWWYSGKAWSELDTFCNKLIDISKGVELLSYEISERNKGKKCRNNIDFGNRNMYRTEKL